MPQQHQLPPLPELIPITSSPLFADPEDGSDFPSLSPLAQILQDTPFYTSLGLGRAGGEITDQAVVRLLRETRQEIEEKLKDSRDYQTQAVKLKLRNKLRQMITEKEGDEDIRAVQASAIMGPEMGLTSEEKNVLARFLRDQAAACKHCCPVRSIFISTYSNTQTFTSI